MSILVTWPTSPNSKEKASWVRSELRCQWCPDPPLPIFRSFLLAHNNLGLVRFCSRKREKRSAVMLATDTLTVSSTNERSLVTTTKLCEINSCWFQELLLYQNVPINNASQKSRIHCLKSANILLKHKKAVNPRIVHESAKSPWICILSAKRPWIGNNSGQYLGLHSGPYWGPYLGSYSRLYLGPYWGPFWAGRV